MVIKLVQIALHREDMGWDRVPHYKDSSSRLPYNNIRPRRT